MDWNALTEYFSKEQEESDQLEFKSGKCLVSDVYAEVAALSNTDGGIIILGAPREVEVFEENNNSKKNKRERRKVCIGPLDPSQEDRTTDSILQMLMNSITPSIVGIKVHKLGHESGFIYVIYVPKSINSPHQVDGTYYMRVGTMKHPAPHGFVEALFNKRKPTKLNHLFGAVAKPYTNYYSKVNMQLTIGNASRYPVHNVAGFMTLLGDVRITKDERFETSSTPVHKWYLTTKIKVDITLVNNIWHKMFFRDVLFHGEYFFVQLYLWANDTEAITRLYKIGLKGIIAEIDMSEDCDMRKEMDDWMGSNVPYIELD